MGDTRNHHLLSHLIKQKGLPPGYIVSPQWITIHAEIEALHKLKIGHYAHDILGHAEPDVPLEDIRDRSKKLWVQLLGLCSVGQLAYFTLCSLASSPEDVFIDIIVQKNNRRIVFANGASVTYNYVVPLVEEE